MLDNYIAREILTFYFKNVRNLYFQNKTQDENFKNPYHGQKFILFYQKERKYLLRERNYTQGYNRQR